MLTVLTVAAPADAVPRLRVSSMTGLVDGQRVRARGDGFTPEVTIVVVMCQAGATTSDDCDTANVVFTQSDASGAFTTAFFLHRRITTVSGGEQDCASAPGACLLVAANLNQQTEAAGVPLEFDPNVPPLPTFLVYVTLDPVGTVSPDGVATLTGMIRCSRDASGTIEANLLQRNTSGHNINAISCVHEPTPWTLKVRAFQGNPPFERGHAVADVVAFATDAGYNAGDLANGPVDLLAS
jgi:hypothetical protein